MAEPWPPAVRPPRKRDLWGEGSTGVPAGERAGEAADIIKHYFIFGAHKQFSALILIININFSE